MSRQLYRSTAVVGGMTLLSRISGMARDALMAVLFAAGAGMDAFLVAFKIPNFLRRIFAEGAFTQAFVPVLSSTRETGSEDEVRDLLNVVTGTLAVVLLGIAVIGVVASPVLIYIFAPGFHASPDKFDLAADLLRITFPYILFISLVSLAAGILNSYGHFALPAFTPVLLNLSIIGSAALLAPHLAQPIMALAIGVFIGGVAQLLLQLPALWRMALIPKPCWAWKDPRVRKILRLMLPVIFASSVSQIALLLDTIIASFLPTGSISWLYFADRLMEFPLGIFTIAIATVILPSLSAQHARASIIEFSRTMDWALRMLVVFGVPAMVGLLVLAGPLVTTLFHYHAFTDEDVYMSRAALSAFAFGFMGFSLVKVLLPGFYARQDTRTPVRVAVISLSCSMAMSLGFVGIALWQDWPAPHTGLALATSLGAFVNAGQLYYHLRKSGAYTALAGWGVLALRVALAALAMAAVVLWVAGPLQQWLDWGLWQRLGHLGLTLAAAGATYFAVLGLLGARPRHLHAWV